MIDLDHTARIGAQQVRDGAPRAQHDAVARRSASVRCRGWQTPAQMAAAMDSPTIGDRVRPSGPSK